MDKQKSLIDLKNTLQNFNLNELLHYNFCKIILRKYCLRNKINQHYRLINLEYELSLALGLIFFIIVYCNILF